MYSSRSLLFLAFSLCIVAATTEGLGLFDVCYDEYGCFTSSPPFGLTLQRPLPVLPDSPDVINTQFFLYTRESPNGAQVINRKTTLGSWNKAKSTKILVHGFLDTVNSTWWPEMKNALLQVEDCNVILTSYSPANYFPYSKATANAQIVGVDIALLVNKMIKEQGANPANFHIIAHSLGAAVAGYAGQRINGLGRITGLDPAGPFFANTDPIVHLDPTDAAFVDIIHTDGSPTLLLGFGTQEQLGHVDFYLNGGENQPSCEKTTGKAIDAILNLGPLDIFGPMDIQGFFNTTLCSHFAAVHAFTNSILNRCVYRGFVCTSNEQLQNGECILFPNEGNFMGYHVSPRKALGKLYLDSQTADRAPFCISHYQITLESGSAYLQTKGTVRLTLVGNLATETVLFDSDDTWFTRNSVKTRYIPIKSDLGSIQRINVEFQRTDLLSLLHSSKWEFTNVIIADGDRQKSVVFCPGKDTTAIESGDVVEFSSC